MPVRFVSRLSSKYNPFFLYTFMMFFIVLADGIMSYQVPVLMDRAVGTTWMGVILACSSVAGMIVDFLFSQHFGHKRSRFFNKILIATVLFFPMFFLFWLSVPSFILAMVIWGVYFEAIVFSNFHAIHEYVEPAKHLWAWGILSVVKNIGWVIGPILASLMDANDPMHALYGAFGFYALGSFLFIVRALVYRHYKHGEYSTRLSAEKPESSHPFRMELSIWKVYSRVMWPLLMLFFLFFLIDSTFFSIGPVFGEEIAKLHPYGGLFISMYTIPTAVFVFLSSALSKRWGKKRASFISGIWAGIGLIVLSQVGMNPVLILAMTAIASIGLASLHPALTAAFEDYVARSGTLGNDIIGLTAIVGSLAYVVGPLVSGFLSDLLGSQAVFGFWGVLLLGASVFSAFYVKRKIRLPQAEVTQIVAEGT